MKLFLKKINFTGLISIFLLISLKAQIMSLDYRIVPQENIEEFLHCETTHWAKIAQKAITDGNTHSLSKTAHSIYMRGNSGAGKSGSYIVATYSKVSKMDKYLAFESEIWQPFVVII